ncbi:MAG: hypothetical protein QUS08_04480 [Methanothrix sp.]|nr:hypothetical protein [Methanothrix sp.]
MKEIFIEGKEAPEQGLDECCSIAESMLEEIHQIILPEMPSGLGAGRHKGSLKRRLLRQIRQARRMAALG